MILSHIVAAAENGVIGKDNQLLWHFPEDLKYFKKRTTGKIMIMGRKTFDSFKGKPLPNRYHIVITRNQKESTKPNVCYVSSLPEAYRKAESLIMSGHWPEEVMVIGGGEIYRQSFKDIDFIYITRIPGAYQGDTTYEVNLPNEFGIAFSQFSTEHPGVHYEIWSKQQIIAD